MLCESGLWSQGHYIITSCIVRSQLTTKDFFSATKSANLHSVNLDLEFPSQSKHLINEQVKKCFPFPLNSSETLNIFRHLRRLWRHARSCKNKAARYHLNFLAIHPAILKHVETHSRCHSRMPQETLPSLFISSRPDAITVSLNQTAASPLRTWSRAQRKDQSHSERAQHACKEAGGANKMG